MKIELKHVDFSYDNRSQVLKDISLTIEDNESVAVVGQNGAGKTTMVKLLNGILKPTGGDILFDGKSIVTSSVADLAKRVGYVFQNPDDQLFLTTVLKELEFGPKQLQTAPEKRTECVKKAAKICGLTELLEAHPLDLGAAKKKFCTIGSVLSMDTDVVIFDEPTMGQDIQGVKRLSDIMKELKREGKTCITITHDMKFAAGNFDRMIVLLQGQVLLDGETKEVFSQPKLLSQSYITPPPITRVCQKCGIGDQVFTVDGFREEMRKKVCLQDGV